MRTWIASLIAALAVFALPASAAAAPTVPWGFQEIWGPFTNSNGVSFDITDQAELAGGAGATTARLSVDWQQVEADRGSYDWSSTDARYAALTANGMRPILLVGAAPTWARPADWPSVCGTCTWAPLPDYDQDWYRFVRAAMERYPNSLAVEVWNEPNANLFFEPAADPDRYTDLLRLADKARRTSGYSQPLLLGGLAAAAQNSALWGLEADSEFLDRVYADGGKGLFDGIGYHPYPDHPPWVENTLANVDRVAAVRDSHGDSAIPFWITELGIPTLSAFSPDGVAPQDQATMLAELYYSLRTHYELGSFIVYRLFESLEAGPKYYSYGFVDEHGTAKPALGEIGPLLEQGGVKPPPPPPDTPPSDPAPPQTAPGPVAQNGPRITLRARRGRNGIRLRGRVTGTNGARASGEVQIEVAGRGRTSRAEIHRPLAPDARFAYSSRRPISKGPVRVRVSYGGNDTLGSATTDWVKVRAN